MSAADTAGTADAPQTQTIDPSADAQSSGPLAQKTDQVIGDIVRSAGIPAHLLKGFSQEQPETEEPAPETEESAPVATEVSTEEEPAEQEPVGDAEEEETTDEQQTEEDETEDEPQGKEVSVEKLQKRNYKLRKQNRTYKDKVAELEAKVAASAEPQPINIVPTIQDPLAGVEDLKALNEIYRSVEIARNFAEDNPDGWIANEGTPQEQSITPEQAKSQRRYFNDILNRLIPQKERELREIRPGALRQAEAIMPNMLKKGTDDYRAYGNLLAQFPQLAAHPAREVLLAAALRGFKQAEDEKAGTNGSNGKKLEVPEKILKAREERETVPLKKQALPGRTPVAPPQTAALDKAMAKLKSGRALDADFSEAIRQGLSLSRPKNHRVPVPT